MDLTEIAGIPIITALIYLIMSGYKYLANDNQKLTRLIPIFAGLLGIILGVVAFYTANDIVPCENVFSAALLGAVSGLAATGGNQIYKQLKPETSDWDKDETVEQQPNDKND